MPLGANNIPVSRRFVTYLILTGAAQAILGFGEIIARKSLGASALAITLLTMIPPVTSFATIWWGAILVGRDQRRWLMIMGTAAYLVILSGSALSNINHLLVIYLLFHFAWSIFGPAETRIMQQHIHPSDTGKTYGMAIGLRMGLAAAVTAGAGFWMDHVTGGFRQVFPLSATIGMIGLVMIASVPTGSSGEPMGMNRELIIRPWRETFQLLARRRDFLRFEIAFMIYGIAFMMLMPVVPIFLVDELKLSYATIGLARGAASQLIMIPAMLIFGRLFDRSTPHRMGVWIFSLLALYPLILLTAGKVEGELQIWLVYAAFLVFGVVMSGLIVIWNLSTLRFARGEDVSVYQSVHVAATGVRGMFAPFLGYAIMSWFGIQTALIVSAALWVVAGAAMVLMRRIDRRSGEATSLRAAVKM